MSRHSTVLFVATDDWYFASHRLPLARGAVEAGHRVLVATRVRDHGESIRAAGCELIPLQWRRGVSRVWSEARTLAALLRLYRSRRPDIVHHIALKPVVYGSLAAAITGAPAVVNAVAGLGYVFTGKELRARLLRPPMLMALRTLLCREGTVVITQNPDDRDFLVTNGVLRPEQAVIIRGAGVDLRHFKPASIPHGVCIVILAGRMVWHKGVKEFVEAARAIRAMGVGARFVLVGDHDSENPAGVPRRTLSDWHVSGDVEWWGHREDMCEVLQQAHILCAPSHGGEGLPKILLEGAACGLPLVATDVAGSREVVRPEENGILVPARDSKALASALTRLIDDPALRGRMGMRGRAMAEAEFSVDRVVAETMELYRRISP